MHGDASRSYTVQFKSKNILKITKVPVLLDAFNCMYSKNAFEPLRPRTHLLGPTPLETSCFKSSTIRVQQGDVSTKNNQLSWNWNFEIQDKNQRFKTSSWVRYCDCLWLIIVLLEQVQCSQTTILFECGFEIFSGITRMLLCGYPFCRTSSIGLEAKLSIRITLEEDTSFLAKRERWEYMGPNSNCKRL